MNFHVCVFLLIMIRNRLISSKSRTAGLIICDLVVGAQVVWIISLLLLKHPYIILIRNGFPLLSDGKFLCCCQIFEVAQVSLDV